MSTGAAASSVAPALDLEALGLRALEAAPIAVVVLRLDGRVEYVNPRFERLAGWTLRELRGCDWLETCAPVRERDAYRARLAAAAAGGGDPGTVRALVTRDGGERELEWSHALVRDPSGAPAAVVAFGQDVTERRRAVEALRSQERTLRLFYDLPFIGMAITSPQSKRWLQVNDTLCDILGYGREELTALSWTQVTHPDDLDADLREFERVMRGESDGYKLDKRFVRKDGAIVHATIDVKGIRRPDGELDSFVATVADVTARHVALERVRRAEQRLAEAHRIAGLGAWEVDLRTGETWWSETQNHINGVPPGTRIDQERFIELLHPDDRPAFAEAFARALAEGRVEHTFRIWRPDGELRTMAAVATVTYDAAGRPERVSGTNQDITERVRADAALRESEERHTLVERAVNDALWDWDLRTGGGYASPRWYELAGLDASTPRPGRDAFLAAVHPDDRDAVAAALDRHVELGVRFDLEHRLLGPDGDVRWVRTRGDAVRDGAGRAHRLVGACTDVTERRRVRARLVDAEARQRAIVEGAFDGILLIDAESRRIERVNPAFCRLVGEPEERLQGSDVTRLDCTSPQHPGESVLGLVAEGRLCSVEAAVVRRADGTTRDIELSASRIRLDGRPFVVAVLRDTTEREQEKRRVADQARLLDLIFAHTLDNMVVLDSEYRFVRVSEAYARACQRPASTLLGRNHFEVFPSDFEAEHAPFRREKRTYFRSDRPFVYADHPEWGTSYWDLGVVPILDASGELSLFLMTLEDVTHRRHAQQAVREREERLRLALEASDQVAWDLDPVERVVRHAAPGAGDAGVVETEPLDIFLERVHPDDRTAAREAIDACLSGATSELRADYRVAATGGGWRWVLAVARVVARDERGRPLRMIGTHTDVDASRRAHEESRLKQAAIDSAINAIAFADASGRLTYVNDAFLKMWGYSTPADVLGRAATEFWEAPDEAARVMEALGRDGAWTGELRARACDGASLVIQVSARLAPPERGRPAMLMASFVDLTRRVAAERAVSEQLREKDMLLREIHHRVKNNLQIIGSLLHFQAKKASCSDAKQSIVDVRRRLFAMSLMHDRLYRTTSLSQLDFGEYCRALVDMLTVTFEGQGSIDVLPPAERVELSLEQALPAGMILCELITNVCKYAWPGSDAGAAVVSIGAEGGRATLVVRDDGVGFPTSFDPATTESFGWQLVRTLVGQLEGDYRVGGGPGAHVEVSFPIYPSGPAPDVAPLVARGVS